MEERDEEGGGGGGGGNGRGDSGEGKAEGVKEEERWEEVEEKVFLCGNQILHLHPWTVCVDPFCIVAIQVLVCMDSPGGECRGGAR